MKSIQQFVLLLTWFFSVNLGSSLLHKIFSEKGGFIYGVLFVLVFLIAAASLMALDIF